MIYNYKNVAINYTDNGEGKTVVLLHGFLEDLTIWKEIALVISKTHRVIAIDLFGHGKTPCLGYIHTMEDMAKSINALLNHLNIKDAVIIGHSMGGYVSLAFSELFPAKVNGIGLVNSTSEPDSEEKKQNRDRAIKAVKHNQQTFVGMSVANLFAQENRERFLNEIFQIKKQALKTPVQGIIAALEGMKIRPSRTDFFKSLECKKMVVIGQHDPVMNPKSTRQLFENSDVEILELSGGHMSYIENLEDLSDFIVHFIDF